MRIAIDAMGGDNAPQASVEGAVLYDQETRSKHKLVLMGDQNLIEASKWEILPLR